MVSSERPRVTALLGPTNTGKTYLAIERMLGHASGMAGFPLRLLARENYDRAVRLKGQRQVALVTGEEKIVPPGARYFFCTVESMPVDRPVDFLVVDEVQLCADPERGHVFTDRLLHARGAVETMFLGAETIRPVLQKLVPEAEYVSRPRFSTLSYSGPKKITRLPPRSAVVAFSAADVYAIAELMRRQRGGTAVVLGALSPRTRNAQVALFEAGEVDYLVATDAIGMGLNLNLDHVAFSRLAKFDGRAPRRLHPAEVAQIAGRAGRHMSDGSFGPTAELGAMAPDLVEAVENHRFDPLRFVFWRNRTLDVRSPQALLKSLECQPPAPELVRAREADDHLALLALSRDHEIEALATNRAAVRLLWEVCRVPDFRKILSDQHTRLLARLYRLLMTGEGVLPEDWVAGHVDRIDRTEGDIDALVSRIAHVRTWTYITHRGDWFADSAHWQERTRAIEDKLSDALHERLTQRFVDRRTATLVRRLQDGDPLLGAIRKNGEVLVEGEFVGQLDGFRFVLDAGVEGDDAKPLLAAARRALAAEVPARVRQFEQEPDRAFGLDQTGRLTWHGTPVARLLSGDRPLAPRIELLPSEFLDGAQRERMRRRLADWLEGHLRRRLQVLFRAGEAALTGASRGLVYQLVEALGTVPRGAVQAQIANLTKADRRALSALGVRLGAASVFLPALMKPRSARLRALLWGVQRGLPPPPLPAPAAMTCQPEAAVGDDEAFWLAIGYRRFGGGAEAVSIRADALERLADAARKLSARGVFTATPELRRLAGCGDPALAVLMAALGYRVEPGEAGLGFASRKANGGAAKDPPEGDGSRRGGRRRRRKRAADAGEDSPFAKLRDLKIAP